MSFERGNQVGYNPHSKLEESSQHHRMNTVIEFTIDFHPDPARCYICSAGLNRSGTTTGFFTRLHGPTKATTPGVGAMVLASSLYFTATQPGYSLHEIAVMVFLFITAPVSAHLLAKAALHRRAAKREVHIQDKSD